MIQIDSFARKKKTSTSSSTGSSGTGFANTSPSSSSQWTGELETHYFWGQPYNGTQDVEGDLTGVGGVTASGNISTSGEIFATGNITTNDSVSCEGLTVTDSATINDIVATSIDSDYIHSDEGSIDEFGSLTANITDLTVEQLTVTKQAHFFNLTIDEIKSVGGQIILSAGNATIDYVTDMGSSYILAWKKTDDENGVENQFIAGDQVICQTFNRTDATGQNVSNKYYWALVNSIGTGTYTIDGEDVECHFINLSKTSYDGSSVPEVGDKICQLGYRGNDDSARQSAIILSAYKSPDPNVTAPSIVQYAGIDSFSLQGCIVNKMSPSENLFTGNFKVVNGSSTTDVIDLIQGQYPQVIVDSEQAWMMADSSGKTYVGTDYQNVPTTIQAFLGSQIIPYSEWITGSQIKYRNQTYRLTGTAPSPGAGTGLLISSITRNTNDVTIGWTYTPNVSYDTQTQTTVNNGTSVSNTDMEITLVFTHSGTTYTVTKKVPFNVIKASAVTQGADAEIDKLMVDKLDLTVTLDNKLTCKVDAKVFHVKGSQISQLTDLTDYTANLLLSNNDTVTLSKSTYFYRTSNISNSYSSMTNPPTSAVLRLYKSGTLVDEVPVAIKFDSGSIFTITDNAITSAVSQANGYTDSQVSVVTQTANSISSRVTAIENDYVTSSELTQTANNIQLNVYDELRNKTGIDIANGKITLNGNTDVNGTLTLSDSNQGFILQGSEGLTQISPQSIGTYTNFRNRSFTTVTKVVRDNEPGDSDGAGNYMFRFSSQIPIGVVGSGKTITISPGTRTYYNTRGVTVTGAEGVKTYTIFEDGVQKASGNWSSGDFTYTCAGGSITVVFSVNTIISGADLPEDLAYAIPNATVSFSASFSIPNDAYMLIGYDGMAINFGTSATAYMGAESTTFYYGNYGLQISNAGLKKWNGSNWIGLNDLNVKTFSTSYTLADSDDFLIFQGTSSTTLTLGNGGRKGRKIYVKDRGSGGLTLSGTIYKQNDRSSSNSVSMSDTMVFLIWDGSAWNLGYCG